MLTHKNNFENEAWFNKIEDSGQYVYRLIIKGHDYFKAQDCKYRRLVSITKVFILFLVMINTLVLGLKGVIPIDIQIVIGISVSAFITFITAVLSYFNLEQYWMRNIAIHIELNIMRDNFVYDASCEKLDKKRVEYYRDKLETIQNRNIKYWESSINKI